MDGERLGERVVRRLGDGGAEVSRLLADPCVVPAVPGLSCMLPERESNDNSVGDPKASGSAMDLPDLLVLPTFPRSLMTPPLPPREVREERRLDSDGDWDPPVGTPEKEIGQQSTVQYRGERGWVGGWGVAHTTALRGCERGSCL